MKIKQLITKKFLLLVSMLAVMFSLAGCDDELDKPFEYDGNELVIYTMNMFQEYASVPSEYSDYYLNGDDELAKSAVKGINQAKDTDKVGSFQSYSDYINGYYQIPDDAYSITNEKDAVSVTVYNYAKNREVEITVKYVENPDYYIQYSQIYAENMNGLYNVDVLREYLASQGIDEYDLIQNYNTYYGTNISTLEEFIEIDMANLDETIKADLQSNGVMPYKAEEMVVNAVYSKGELMQSAGKNTLIGMGTVFVVLIFISFIISLFKYLPALFTKKPKLDTAKKDDEKKVAPAAATTSVATPAASDDLMNDEELVAVITAAVYAAAGAGATSKDTLVVRSIKRVRR